jgi:hypothetical protein
MVRIYNDAVVGYAKVLSSDLLEELSIIIGSDGRDCEKRLEPVEYMPRKLPLSEVTWYVRKNICVTYIYMCICVYEYQALLLIIIISCCFHFLEHRASVKLRFSSVS